MILHQTASRAFRLPARPLPRAVERPLGRPEHMWPLQLSVGPGNGLVKLFRYGSTHEPVAAQVFGRTPTVLNRLTRRPRRR